MAILSACASQNSGVAPVEQTHPVDPVVIRINAFEFTQSQLDQELAFDRAVHLLTTGQELTQQDPQQKLERLSTGLLIDQQAREAGILADDEIVADALEAFVAERGGTVETLDAALQSQGVTLVNFSEMVVARTVRAEKYLVEVVLADAETPNQQQEKLAAWLAGIEETAEIEILYEPPAEAPRVGAVAPDFTLTNLNGEQVSLSQFRGQPVVVNFWATWCVPCRKEMPTFQQAFEKHQGEGLVILAIDLAEDTSQVEPFVEELGLSYEILYDSDGAINRLYLVNGLPRTLFIDRQGVIQHIQVGEVQEVLLQGFLGRIL
ncbi:MAG: redoxin domain-containing protein [Chloroflexota bacterium]